MHTSPTYDDSRLRMIAAVNRVISLVDNGKLNTVDDGDIPDVVEAFDRLAEARDDLSRDPAERS